MKNVVLIGASGFVGTAILNELLNRGSQVTAVVRNPEKIAISNSNLSVVKEDVSKPSSSISLLKILASVSLSLQVISIPIV